MNAGTLTIKSGSKFYGNASKDKGGAIYSVGTLNLENTGMI